MPTSDNKITQKLCLNWDAIDVNNRNNSLISLNYYLTKNYLLFFHQGDKKKHGQFRKKNCYPKIVLK